MGTYDTRDGYPLSPDEPEPDCDACARCGADLRQLSFGRHEKLSDEGFCSWICVIGYHAEILRQNIPNGNVLCVPSRRQLIESTAEIAAAVIQIQAAPADRLDAQEATIAELKDTCARLRATMIDRKLYEAAANHIEVLEAKIQELQLEVRKALGDS